MQQQLKKNPTRSCLAGGFFVFVFNKDNKTIGLDVGQGRVGLVPYHLESSVCLPQPFYHPVPSGTNTLCFIKETIHFSFTFNRKFTAYPELKIS